MISMRWVNNSPQFPKIVTTKDGDWFHAATHYNHTPYHLSERKRWQAEQELRSLITRTIQDETKLTRGG